jgi:hypothetical protein
MPGAGGQCADVPELAEAHTQGEGLVLTANLVRRDSASTQFREFTVPTWS